MNRPDLMSHTLAETHFGQIARSPSQVAPVALPLLRRVMAGITAFAMAITVVTASAFPVRADERSDNLAKALAAIAIIGIIANQAGKDRNDDKPRHPPYHPPYNPPYHPPYHPPKPEPAAKRIPGACAIVIENRGGDVTVYAERCIRDKGFSYRLPSSCARDITIYGREDRIYPERCLRDAGFRIDENRKPRRHGRADW